MQGTSILKAKNFQIKMSLDIRGAMTVNSVRIEFGGSMVHPANAEIPLKHDVSVVSGDQLNLTVDAQQSYQCFLLAWLFVKRNKPVQVRLGLRHWHNTWDGTEVNVYQSLFHIERRSSGSANGAES